MTAKGSSSPLTRMPQCNRVLLHESLIEGSRTIYPLTDDQFHQLTAYLVSESGEVVCPLPIQASPSNRPRYNPWHAIKECHIFRNRYERRTLKEFPWPDTYSHVDYPEITDSLWQQNHMLHVQRGAPLNETELRAATQRLKLRSHPSPMAGYGEDVIEAFIAKHKAPAASGTEDPA